jgi:hypothetical protein
MQNVPLAASRTQVVESTGAPFSNHETGKTIRWKPFPDRDLFCQVSSPDANLLKGAATLLAPWLCDVQEVSTPSSLFRWCVAPAEPIENLSSSGESSGRWRVRGRVNGIDQELVVADWKSALTVVEYSAAQVLVDYVASDEGSARTGLFAMHSALLCRDGFGVLVVGPSEAGKSTLSCALWQSGWSLRSDDFVFIDSDGVARPVPRRVSLRSGSRALLGEALWQRIGNTPSCAPHSGAQLFHPHEMETDSARRRMSAAAP